MARQLVLLLVVVALSACSSSARPDGGSADLEASADDRTEPKDLADRDLQEAVGRDLDGAPPPDLDAEPDPEAAPEAIGELDPETIADPGSEPAPDRDVEPPPEVGVEAPPEAPLEALPEAPPEGSPEVDITEASPFDVEPGPDLADALDTALPDLPGGDEAPECQDMVADPDPDDDQPPECPAPCHPIITELLALNDGSLHDEDGEASDWIELYNPTSLALSLEGWHLTDDPTEPARWTFPARTLGPGGYLVVFASGKDRAPAEGELHADFKLAREGEYLALVSPALEVVQAFPGYPPQVADVSYGVAVTITRAELLGVGAPARCFLGAWAPGDGWLAPGFDDAGPEWVDALTGVGFDRATSPDVPTSIDKLGTPQADSVADWSATGQQGANGWTYGYYDRSADPQLGYTAAEFVPFPRNGGGWGPDDFWNGTAYEWFPGDPPWAAVGAEYVHPSGANNGALHWVIRRYQAEVEGAYLVQWHVAKANPEGGGVTARVFLDGTSFGAATLAGSNTAGLTRTLVLPHVLPGEPIDFALGPEGPDGDPHDASDGSYLTATLWRLPRVAEAIATDLGDALPAPVTSLPVRLAFDVATQGAPNRLTLRMKYDDGFAAWLNGAPLVTANAPASLDASPLATADRPAEAAVTSVPFVLDEHLSLLTPGSNLLALLALNSAPDDPTLLVLPELEARTVTYAPETTRYYRTPTPGADNDDGPLDLGPIVEHRTAAGAVPPGQPLLVSARVYPTSAPLLGVTLVHRVMFGPEQSVAMTGQPGGVFAATLPAGLAAPGEMVRWYVLATDADGHTTRCPPFDDPLDSEQYHGTVVADPSVVSDLPVFHWFVEDPAAANTWTGARGSLFYGAELYDNVRFDLHGQSTSGFPKKSYDVDFTSDHRFLLEAGLGRMKDLNLLTNWADKTKVRNTMAYEAYRDAGLGYHLAFPVRVQQNGAFFEVADFVEDGDDRWLERLGLDGEGAMYKMYDGLWTAAAGEKKTRKWEDNSDLAAFIAGLDQTDDALRVFLYDHVNLAAMANFYAGLTLSATTDCCHKNYYAYRDTNGTGEWRYLPWDADLTFGHNWTPQKYYFEDALYPQNPLFVGWSKLTQALQTLPEFHAMYLRRLRTVMDRQVQPPGTPAPLLKIEARMDELVAQIGADAARDHDAWPLWGLDETMEQAVARVKADFLAPRRTFLFETMVEPNGPIPPAQEQPAIVLDAGDPSPDAPAEAWLVLLNPGAVAVDLSGWKVEGEISLTLQPGTVLPAGGRLYLSPDVVAFRARTEPPTGGQGLFVQGNYAGQWSQLEAVYLVDEEGSVVPSSR